MKLIIFPTILYTCIHWTTISSKQCVYDFKVNMPQIRILESDTIKIHLWLYKVKSPDIKRNALNLKLYRWNITLEEVEGHKIEVESNEWL